MSMLLTRKKVKNMIFNNIENNKKEETVKMKQQEHNEKNELEQVIEMYGVDINLIDHDEYDGIDEKEEVLILNKKESEDTSYET